VSTVVPTEGLSQSIRLPWSKSHATFNWFGSADGPNRWIIASTLRFDVRQERQWYRVRMERTCDRTRTTTRGCRRLRPTSQDRELRERRADAGGEGARRVARVKTTVVAVLVICELGAIACEQKTARRNREPLRWSAWIEDAAVQRGYVNAGDFAQFGCPPGWMGIEDTAAALRGGKVSTTYMGTHPPPREGTITCVAQREFALPPPYSSPDPERDPIHRPLAPVWVTIGADRTTIGFRSELSPNAAIFMGQDTPCGPRLIGVRLRDLLKWLVDPHAATKRDFLGMISAGCPEQAMR
jgi:hypothetical protein